MSKLRTGLAGAKSIGRGLLPSVKPAVITAGSAVVLGVGGSAAAKAITAWGDSAEKKGRAENPPVQVIPVPPDGQLALADNKTGGLILVGQGPPAQPGFGPERSNERETKTLLYVGGAVAALAIFLTLRGGK